MFLQIAGAILLLTAAVLSGQYLRANERHHLRALQCALFVVRHAQQKIELFDVQTADILSDFDDSDFHRERFVQKNTDFCTGVSCISNSLLEQDKKLFMHFACQLGAEYRADALKLCIYTASQLTESLHRAENEYAAHRKLYTVLPIMLAFSLVVLFL